MRIIFCDSVIDHKLVEPAYATEQAAAKKAGFVTSVFSYEELTEGNVTKALKFVRPNETTEAAIYRGWMLTPHQYENLYNGLLQKKIQLINNPTEFKHCHYFPESYPKIKHLTPFSNWTINDETHDFAAIESLTNAFGNSPVIVKDYVKSEKHHWAQACFIPDASDKVQVKRVVDKFIELRGNALNEGLVFRQFEALEYLTKHSKSGMPLTKEWRLFFAHSSLVSWFNYWDEGDYGNTVPELTSFLEVAKTIDSHFFTMDIAQKKNGHWIIMELGDGQTAGLPENVSCGKFYEGLGKTLR